MNVMIQEQLNIISLDARLLLERLIQILPFPGYIKNSDGRYLACNEIFADLIFGASTEELKDKSLDDFGNLLSNEEIEESRKIDAELIKNGGSKQIEVELVCADGVNHYFHEIKTSFRIDEQNSGIIGIMIDLTETKEIKEAFANQEKYFKIFMDYIPDAIYFKDKDGKYIKANNTEVSKLGARKETDVLGKRIDEFYPRERAEQIIKEEQGVITNGTILEKEESLKFPDGKMHYVHTTKVPFPDSKGEIVGLFGISRDITNKKLNEEDLKYKFKFEKMLTKISHNLVRTGMNNFDEGLEFIARKLMKFFSAGFVHFFMSNNAELEYTFSLKDYAKIILEDESSIMLNEMIHKHFDISALRKHHDYIISSRSNENVDLLLPINSQDKLVGIIVIESVAVDYNLITRNSDLLNILIEILGNSFELYTAELERKKIESKMLKMVKAVEQSANIVMILDERFKTEYVNRRFEDLMGFSTEDVIGQNPSKFIIGISDELEQNKIWNVLRDGKEWKGIFLVERKNRPKIWLSAVISPIFNNEGSIVNFIAILEDVTEKIVAQNQKAISQKLESIGQLASGIAHEINTPMQFISDNNKFLCDSFKAVLGYLENLENLCAKDNLVLQRIKELKNEIDYEFIIEEIPEAIKQSKEGIDRVSKIVKAMKAFAHPGESVKSLNDINAAIKNTVVISKNEWKYYSNLELKLDEKIPPVNCEIDSINQVILNMIINAAHANEEKVKKNGGSKEKIIIETSVKDGYLEILIEDTGIGIPRKNLDRIFDPFFTTKEVGKGTGQGLAIAYDIIVNKHGGNIFVDSEENIGTKFRIQLPIDNEVEQ